VLPSIEDAKRRLLQPDCRVIPAAASLLIALLGGEEIGSAVSVGTLDGLDLSAFNKVIARRQLLMRDDLEVELLSDVVEAFQFDFERQNEWGSQDSVIRVPVSSGGKCWGVIQWLKLKLDATTYFENHPGTRVITSHWRPVIYLMPNPIEVEVGQTAVIRAMHDRISPMFLVERFE